MIPPPSTSTPWLYWAAAFIDGEGHFGIQNANPMMTASQNDPELLYRLRSMFGGSVRVKKNAPRQHVWVLCGVPSVGVAMTLYLMMSEKRQREIRRVIERWRSAPHRGLTVFERPVLREDAFFQWCRDNLDDRAVRIIERVRQGETQTAMAPGFALTPGRVHQIVRAALSAYLESLGLPEHPQHWPPLVHGTMSAYVHHHCRCAPCRTTHSWVSNRARREGRARSVAP